RRLVEVCERLVAKHGPLEPGATLLQRLAGLPGFDVEELVERRQVVHLKGTDEEPRRLDDWHGCWAGHNSSSPTIVDQIERRRTSALPFRLRRAEFCLCVLKPETFDGKVTERLRVGCPRAQDRRMGTRRPGPYSPRMPSLEEVQRATSIWTPGNWEAWG